MLELPGARGADGDTPAFAGCGAGLPVRWFGTVSARASEWVLEATILTAD